MNSFKHRIILGICIIAGAVSVPAISVSAATSASLLESAGISSVLEQSAMTQEDYISVAQENEGVGLWWGYSNIGICNTSSGNLNVRAAASKDGKLVGKLPKNAACEVLEEEDGWAHITSGDVEGYVSLEYLLTGSEARVAARDLVNTVVISQVDALNVREKPDTSAAVYTQMLKGEELDYIETLENGWIKVDIDGDEAYVAQEYVTVTDALETAVTMTQLLYGQGVSNLRVDLCEYAKQYVGNPYVWGGVSLTKGADCSGFVLSVFKKFGIKLSHHAASQAKEGKKISKSDLQPGDLIFYGNSSGAINHVAIYIGNGQVVQARNKRYGITITKYNYRTPVKYVRVIND